MTYTAQTILDALLTQAPRPTADAPKDARGIYGLVDHHGQLRYIGSTSSDDETLYKRIHQRHRTGSEDTSHYLSRMYNSGRMWRDRHDTTNRADSSVSKALRNAFIAEHCRAVWAVVPDDIAIAALELEILSLAPDHAIAWNRRATAIYEEPTELVDATIARLGWGRNEIAAIERQRYQQSLAAPAIENASQVSGRLPSGDFRFFELHVETANSDRASICQIGVACVRADNTVETWVTYVDPLTANWSCSWIHGITAQTVEGAATFAQVFPLLDVALAGQTVYQQSSFDQSAIAAACAKAGIEKPNWNWQDSVRVARQAWPERKGNGGHGLASLKDYFNLQFTHHDAGEDARALAEIVLFGGGSRRRLHFDRRAPPIINKGRDDLQAIKAPAISAGS